MQATIHETDSEIERARAVHVAGIGTAVPSFSVSQQQVLDFVLSRFDIQPATKILYQKTLGNNSIQRRHFAIDRLEDVLDTDRDRIFKRFEKGAVALSTNALNAALKRSGVIPASVDFIAVTTCTGYSCPGLSAYLVETCGLRSTVHTSDMVGMGCGAAIPALQQAMNFIRSNPGSTAAVVATEISSAAFFSNDEADIVISNAIFSDGSAAAILKSASHSASSLPTLARFASLTVPEWRDTLRFKTHDGYLKNVLKKQIPEQAAFAVEKIVDDLHQKSGLHRDDIDHWIVHAGGEKIIDSIGKKLSIPAFRLQSARKVLQNHGNMSSPTVLFVLDQHMRDVASSPGEKGIMLSFGAGFSAHAALLEF